MVGRRNGDSVMALPDGAGIDVNAQTPVGGFGIEQHTAAAAMLGPIHRADIEFGVGIKAGNSLARQFEPGCGIDDGLQLEVDRGLIDPGTVPVEIRRHALEGPCPVENSRAQPGRMRAGAHDRHIAVMPVTLKEGPGLREVNGCCRPGHHRHPSRGRAVPPQ
jgi:hypothetical protein